MEQVEEQVVGQEVEVVDGEVVGTVVRPLRARTGPTPAQGQR